MSWTVQHWYQEMSYASAQQRQKAQARPKCHRDDYAGIAQSLGIDPSHNLQFSRSQRKTADLVQFSSESIAYCSNLARDWH